jgi:hypothetical protein
MGEAGAEADVEADVGVDAGAGVRTSAVVMRQPSGVRVHSRRDAVSESEAVSAEQGGWGNAKRNAKRSARGDAKGDAKRDVFMGVGNFQARRVGVEGWCVVGGGVICSLLPDEAKA